MWEQRQRHNITVGEDWFAGENQHYLLWFHRMARTRLRPTAMEYNMEDVDTDAEDDYDVDTRWGNQPECAMAMMHDFSDLSWRTRTAKHNLSDCRHDRSDVPSSANRLQTGVRRQRQAANVFSPPDQRPPRR
ncbi:hypothetical protein HU200_011960 [Digitaria exilis]|uniref:Uncharacterized protein n=1 Tax=Digitaria exilis TaxID=1010633 RepID=A0A835FF17_9POAL|nr:hypothetical protein HU200_011960 [Digitaria exilis]